MGDPKLQNRPPPRWAIDYAAAALRIGQRVDQIEAALLAKGIDQHAASESIDLALVRNIQEPLKWQRRLEQFHRASRAGSLLVAIVFLCLCFALQGVLGVLKGLRPVIFLLACIWAPGMIVAMDRKRWPAAVLIVAVVLPAWILLLAYVAAVLIYLR